ncbi:hypothetical protein NA56DRAFT_38424 [Hyaloscypha hepaticicola]|uniref:Uncharacterized protein n=1 Tax=Hyaloscypha hepaticicola TaxID=2082293 RepID=A0A2J6PDI9_9HELO|nr:hypothetical protein NA56DRAFT_38424 [Hyaloscypha hepaticicola]
MAPQALPTDAILRASVASTPSQQLALVHRDAGFTQISPDPRAKTQSAGQSVLESLGPFVDASGRQIAVDVLGTSTFVPVTRSGQALPFIYVSSASSAPFTGIPHLIRFNLGPGTVWISTQLLCPSAPPSTLIGLQISTGQLSWSGTPFFSSGPVTSITIPAAASVYLSLELVQQPPSSGASPPTAEFSIQTPQNADFVFPATAGSLASSGSAKWTVLGTSLNLTQLSSPATFDTTLNLLRFPFQADKSEIAVTQSSSQLVTITGSANITSAFWSLSTSSAPSSATDTTLPQASGAGGISVDVQSGLVITPSLYNTSISSGACTLTGQGSTFAIYGQEATGGVSAVTVPLWSPSQFVFRPRMPFLFRYTDQYTEFESWATVSPCTTKLDEPRTINNDRLLAYSLNAALVFIRNGATTTCTVLAPAGDEYVLPQAFAIKNLLLRARIGEIVATGTYVAGTGITTGTLSLQMTIVTALPFLPDPYTTNYTPTTGDFPDLGLDSATLQVLIKWQSGTFTSLDMNLSPPPSLSTSQASPAVEVRTPPVLLDVSTNISQFGVSFVLSDTEQAPSIQNLFLQLPASLMAVTSLPVVQWEPVITDPNPDNFDTPLTFQNSGATTLFHSNSVTLTPVAPRQAIDTLLSDYHASSPSAVTARFTLPFGMTATASLARTLSFAVGSPTLNNIQPTFATHNLYPGDQLSIGAPVSRFLHIGSIQTASPSIPGSIQSPQNAYYNGTATTETVLGVIQPTFTSDFTQNPRIPVTRVDLSGFGESMFSDWRDPTSLPPDISKVALDVLVGRTSKEIVQAFSILYPYGVAVVRTITIERENSATVVRHDSGWQACSDGLYNFPVPAGTTPVVTHPGLVKSVTNVGNIRDLTQQQMYTIPVGTGSIELMPVQFDCFANIANVVLGGTSNGVLALNQTGYVQLTGTGSLTGGQFAQLLQDNGPLGGPVDCVVNVGGGGLNMRILRVGAGASRTDSSSTDYEISMAAYGAPTFPKGGGQWSFVVSSSSTTPQSVDPQKGVPLIQQNASSSTSPAYPFRFADPSDLLATTPASIYSVLQSTGSYRLLFQQPKIEAASPSQISSLLPLYLADPFALSTSTGPFPQTQSCILINDTNWILEIASDGNLQLQLSTPTYTATPVARVLHNNPNIRSIAYTNDNSSPINPSVVTLTVNTASIPSWTFSITNMSFALETDTYGELSRIVAAISGSSTQDGAFSNPNIFFGPKLSVVTKLVSFLENFGPFPPLGMGVSQSFDLTAMVVFDLNKFLSQPSVEANPVAQWFEKYIIDLDFKMLLATTDTDTNFEISAEVTFKIPLTPDGGPMVVFIGAADLLFADAGDTLELTVGAGYGYELDVTADIKAYAYAALTFTLIIGNAVLGFGCTLLVKADIDFGIAEASATAEVRAEVLAITCNPNPPPNGPPSGKSVWSVGQFTLAVEITIFAVLDIDFSYQTECSKNTDNGPCALVDV